MLPGWSLQLRADLFGLVFALLASSLWILTSIYSIGYMRAGHYTHQTGYFASFAVCLSATMGIAFAGNLITFFLFYEMLTLATYPLVVHDRTEEAVAAGRKYLAYTLGAGQLLLLATVAVSFLAPGAAFQPGGFLAGTASLGVLGLVFVASLIGVGAKAAIMPLHSWLPAAMVAPTPVSALLHAVAGSKGRHLRLREAGALCVRRRPAAGHGGGYGSGGGGGADHPVGVGAGPGRAEPQAPARLFDGEPALLHRSGGSHRFDGGR